MKRASLAMAGVALTLAALAAPASAASWTVTQLPQESVLGELFGVSCPTATMCVATGSNNTVATSADPTGGAGAWHVFHPGGRAIEGGAEEFLFPGAQIRGVSCPSTQLCVAVSFDGKLYRSSDPLAGASGWEVVPIGPENSPHVHMTGVSCASASLCVAVAYAGKIVVLGNPAAAISGPTVESLPEPLDMRGVSCYSSALCVAVDNDGDVLSSTNPAGGAGTWTVTRQPAGPGSLYGVSCPSSQLCVTGNAGQMITSTSPASGAWHAVTAGSGLPVTALSCPTGSACAAIDDNSDALASTDPTGPAGAWSFQNVIPAGPNGGPNGMFGISCPSLRLCAAVGTRNQVITSTDPFAGEGEAEQPGSGATPGRPRARITFHPGRRVADRGKRRVRVAFRFRAAGAARFWCRLDRHRWGRCRSPKRYRLGRGTYAFSVFAVGPTGLRGRRASFHFRIGPLHELPPAGSCPPGQPGNTHPCVPTG